MEPDQWIEIFDYAVWGNVAEWVGAVGTAGALLLGVILFWREFVRERHRQRDSVLFHPVPTNKFTNFNVTNTSPLPIYDVEIYARPNLPKPNQNEVVSSEHYVFKRVVEQFSGRIDGGKTEGVSAPIWLIGSGWQYFVTLSFTDARGQHWFLDVTAPRRRKVLSDRRGWKEKSKVMALVQESGGELDIGYT